MPPRRDELILRKNEFANNSFRRSIQKYVFSVSFYRALLGFVSVNHRIEQLVVAFLGFPLQRHFYLVVVGCLFSEKKIMGRSKSISSPTKPKISLTFKAKVIIFSPPH